ncbi:MAG: hypothetical protein ACE5KA_06565 [Nitrososphaerales archaeon]
MFIVSLAWLGIRKVNKNVWYALCIAGTPTLIIATFGESVQFGSLDIGSILSMLVFSIFIAGMILPARIFREA